MWHEARRQEKKIRGMLVDYQRRAERRRDFYETIKADPTQFLQLHGRQCKIHLDPAVAIAGDSPANMMPWQNNLDNMIDRFDVRAHLDYIPDTIPVYKDDLTPEERHCNYESYRILAQNAFLGIREEKFLQQLAYEEQFGITPEESANKKKKLSSNTGAAIGYNYENTEVVPGKLDKLASNHDKDKNSDSSDSEMEIDMDVSIDITKVGLSQANEMNICAQAFGMADNDFYSFLTKDADEAESLRIAREEEQEKAMFSGRKSRRERRQHKEKRLLDHHFTSFSFAVEKPPEDIPKEEKSVSRSPSPSSLGQITYITSFGGEEETEKSAASKSVTSTSDKKFRSSITSKKKTSYADKVKITVSGNRHRRSRSRSTSRRRSRSRSRNGHRRSRSYSKSRSYRHRSRSPYSYRRRRSKSRSRSRSKSSRYHNSSRHYKPSTRRRSISKSRRSRSRSRRRSRSRSLSSDSSSSSRSSHRSPVKRSSPVVVHDDNSDSKNDNSCTNDAVLPVAGPPIKKYYGRKKGDESSSELSLSDSDDTENGTAENPEINVNSNTSTEVQSISNISTGISLQQSTLTIPTISNTNVSIGTTSVTGLFGKTKANVISKTTNKQTNSGGGILNIQDRLKRKMQAQLARTLKADKKAEIERNERVMQQQIERDEEMREMAIKIRRRQRAIRHRYNSDRSSHSSDESRSDSRSRSRSRSKSPESSSMSRSSYSGTVSRAQNEVYHTKDVPNLYAQGSTIVERKSFSREDSKKERWDDGTLYRNDKSYQDDLRTRDESRSYREDTKYREEAARSAQYHRRNEIYHSANRRKRDELNESDNNRSGGNNVKPLVDY